MSPWAAPRPAVPPAHALMQQPHAHAQPAQRPAALCPKLQPPSGLSSFPALWLRSYPQLPCAPSPHRPTDTATHTGTLTTLACWSLQRMDSRICPICTRAHTPWGLPKAPRMPVCSLQSCLTGVTGSSRERAARRVQQQMCRQHMNTGEAACPHACLQASQPPPTSRKPHCEEEPCQGAPHTHDRHTPPSACQSRRTPPPAPLLLLLHLTYQRRRTTTSC